MDARLDIKREPPMPADDQDPTTANAIGHITLVLVSMACAVGLRGIPVFVWIIAYLFSVFVAPTIWKEKQDLTPLIWFLGAVLFGGLTALLYLIGARLLGSNGPDA